MHAARLLAGGAVALAAALVGRPSVANAQTSPIGQGSWIIGGNASLTRSHDNDADQTLTSVLLTPSALVFVRQRLAMGGAVNFGYVSTGSGSSTSFGVGPTVRYYFGDLAGKTFPFLSGMVAPSWTSSNSKGSNVDVSSQTTLLEASAGITHFVATHVGITGEAVYRHRSASNDFGQNHTDNSSYDVGLRFGVTAFVF